MISNSNNLIWLDLEMTGLDPDIHKILEIAVVITDSNLNIINIGPELVIYQPDEILDSMDEWNTKQHNKSGLIARVKADGISITAAEKIVLDYLKQYVPAGVSPMCGNSIYQDRRFLCQYMQTLEKYFHYRHLDVSTLKILVQHWSPKLAEKINKHNNHRAKDDILESIEELRFYRQHFIQATIIIPSK